jgi:SHS2 domain-containing protein
VANRPSYREIEHTADVGLEVEAPDLKSAFELAAAAMFDMIVDLDGVRRTWRKRVDVPGSKDDLENLIVRWLSELLYVSEAEGVVMCGFEIDRMDDDGISAVVEGEALDRSRHAVKLEIKAPTYHGLAIEETERGVAVRVIFDT